MQLNTELHIEKIQTCNEKLIKEIDNYERNCITKYETKIGESPNSTEKLLKDLRIFTEEKRKYLSRFLIDEEEIDKSLNLAKENLNKLNEESSCLDEVKFNGAKKTLKANGEEIDAKILGLLIDDQVMNLF